MAKATEATDFSTKGMLIANFALNILLSAALSLLWGMINGLQMISVLPLVYCEMPGNAQFVFNQIYLIASFNLINVDIITEWFSEFLHL
jgi:hypothetical protein